MVPGDVLRAAPYSLTFDTLVQAKLIACNLNGCGDESDENSSGSLIQTEPDLIVTLSEGLLTNES